MSEPTVGSPTPGRGWTVTGQTQEEKMDGNGRFTEGWTISFLTQYGVAGSVWLPDARYNAANVAAAISDKAATIDAVHVLSDTGK